MKALRVIGLAGLVLLSLWAALLLAMAPGAGLVTRLALLVALAAGLLLTRRFVTTAWRQVALPAVPGLAVVAWHLAIGPSDDRPWVAGQEHTPRITIAGDIVTIATPSLGALVNRVAYCDEIERWTFGSTALMSNLARRGLL